jgi:hypothetical protein
LDSPQDGLDGRGGLLQLVVGDLGEQVVDHVRPDRVGEVVEEAVVTVEAGEAAAEVGPLLAPGGLDGW